MPSAGTPFISLLASFAIGTALTGCTGTEARLETMEATVAARLAAVPDATDRPATVSNVNFADLTAALSQAVAANGSYRAAKATEAEALAGIDAAASGRRPQLTGSALAGRIYEGSPSDRQIDGAKVDVILSQMIFDGGATRAALDQATARAIAARAAVQETGNDVALQAYRAWAELWVVQSRVSMLRARSGRLATIVGQLDRMTESGMIDTSVRDGARVVELDIRAEDARLQGELAAAEAEFRRHFGSVPASVGRPAPLMTSDAARDAAKAWDKAPTLRRAAAELVEAEAAIAAARAALRPTVSLNTAVNSPLDPEDTTDTSVGLQLTYTFNDGGKRRARIAAAEARRDALAGQLDETRAMAQATVAASLAQLAAMEGSTGLMAEKLSATATQAETSEAQLVTGQSTLSALMDAQIADFRAEEQNLRLTADRLILQAEIAAGTGALLSRLDLDG